MILNLNIDSLFSPAGQDAHVRSASHKRMLASNFSTDPGLLVFLSRLATRLKHSTFVTFLQLTSSQVIEHGNFPHLAPLFLKALTSIVESLIPVSKVLTYPGRLLPCSKAKVSNYY